MKPFAAPFLFFKLKEFGFERFAVRRLHSGTPLPELSMQPFKAKVKTPQIVR